MRSRPSNLNHRSTMAFPGRRAVARVRWRRPGKAIVHRPRQIDVGAARSRGVTLAAVLICLLVVMLFSSVLVRTLVLRQRASRRDEQQLQCLFLLESAVERTKVRCAAEPNYSGETWDAAVDRGADRHGIARIRVEPVANEPRLRRVQIEARWPGDPVLRVQQTKELIITLPVLGAAS